MFSWWKKDVKKQSVEELEKSVAKGSKEAKKELARRLIEGEGVEKNEAKAVSLLEDCAAHGDIDAKLTLAKCCALGRGTEQNGKRAEALILESSVKGNEEAKILMGLIDTLKESEHLDENGLIMKNIKMLGFYDRRQFLNRVL